MDGKKFQIGNVSSFIVKKDYSYLCMWMTKLAGRKILIRSGNYSTKKSIWENQHLSWIMYTWAAPRDNVKKQRYCGQLQNHVRIENFCGGRVEKLLSLKIFVFLHGRMTWWVMQRSVWSDIVSWQTRRLYKVTTPCIDGHHFKEQETKSVGELSNTCSQIVLKCLYLERIGRPDIPWSVNRLARSITNGTRLVKNA